MNPYHSEPSEGSTTEIFRLAQDDSAVWEVNLIPYVLGAV